MTKEDKNHGDGCRLMGLIEHPHEIGVRQVVDQAIIWLAMAGTICRHTACRTGMVSNNAVLSDTRCKFLSLLSLQRMDVLPVCKNTILYYITDSPLFKTGDGEKRRSK